MVAEPDVGLLWGQVTRSVWARPNRWVRVVHLDLGAVSSDVLATLRAART